MSLIPYTITALEASAVDSATSGKNIVVGAVVTMTDSAGVVTMFDDAAGSNGSTAKATGADGQVTVFVNPNTYTISVNGSASKVEISEAEFTGTTTDLINSIDAYAADTLINSTGYLASGDGGDGSWKQNGVTGQTPSQSPAQLGGALLNDASGNQWEYIGESVSLDALGALSGGILDDGLVLRAANASSIKTIVVGPKRYGSSLQVIPANNKSWIGFKGLSKIELIAAAPTNIDLFGKNGGGLDGSLDNFTASGIIFDGASKDAAFVAYGCDNVSFIDCEFVNAGTYGLAFQARPSFTVDLPQTDIKLIRCKFNDNGTDNPFDGLDIKYGTGIYLEDCVANNNSDAGINIRGEAVLVGCSGKNNGIADIRLQATDLEAGHPSSFKVAGLTADGVIGLQLQGSALNNTEIQAQGVTLTGNTTSGMEVSGAGKVFGNINGFTIDDNLNGVNVAGDHSSGLKLSAGTISNNTADGFTNAGENITLDAVEIIGNASFGYKENTGADNNYILPSCKISDNGTDISTRIGTELDDGFFAVKTKYSIRAFPGVASGLEIQTDAGGAASSIATVGDAASIDFNILTKGNGGINGFKNDGDRQLFAFRQSSSAAVNYPDFVASATGNAVQFKASGSDTDVNLRLAPQGSGVVEIPTAHVIDHADDAAAAAGGVPVGGIYRTASALKIRVT